jgi:hypothetical protein
MIVGFAVALIVVAGALFWYSSYREDRKRSAEERTDNAVHAAEAGSAHRGDDIPSGAPTQGTPNP